MNSYMSHLAVNLSAQENYLGLESLPKPQVKKRKVNRMPGFKKQVAA